jgi:hypothetical protein
MRRGNLQMDRLDPEGYIRPEANQANVQPEYHGLPDAGDRSENRQPAALACAGCIGGTRPTIAADGLHLRHGPGLLTTRGLRRVSEERRIGCGLSCAMDLKGPGCPLTDTDSPVVYNDPVTLGESVHQFG